jgi:hypothetical protein
VLADSLLAIRGETDGGCELDLAPIGRNQLSSSRCISTVRSTRYTLGTCFAAQAVISRARERQHVPAGCDPAIPRRRLGD